MLDGSGSWTLNVDIESGAFEACATGPPEESPMEPSAMARRQNVLPEGARRCFWMAAGVVSYKLCDRNFDCANCALDAGLRGETLHGAPPRSGARRAPWNFPEDRRYGRAHLWARARTPTCVQLGLDALAAQLLGAVHAVEVPGVGTAVATEESAVRLGASAGNLSFRMPLGGVVSATNLALARDPELVVSDSYGGGWLLELSVPEEVARAQLAALWSAKEMEHSARLLLRRFWRQIGLSLLVASESCGPEAAQGVDARDELRTILGETRYFELVHEALH